MVNIHYAKTNLSKLIAEVEKTGQPVIIARDGTAVVQIVPATKPKKRGLVRDALKGQIELSDDYDQADEEIEKMFLDSIDRDINTAPEEG